MSLFGLLVRRGIAAHGSVPRRVDAAQARAVPGRDAPARPRAFGMPAAPRRRPREPRA